MCFRLGRELTDIFGWLIEVTGEGQRIVLDVEIDTCDGVDGLVVV